ncbi:MAG: cysteine desulfurase family protein [bacterium]
MYFDNNASTRPDTKVLACMQEYSAGNFGNPSSSHSYGRKAKAALEKARAHVARLIGAGEREIVFTSGGTESNNLGISGFCGKRKSGHVISALTEHKSVTASLHRLEEEGREITWLPVSRGGLIDPDDLQTAIRPDTVLVSLMLANGETGVIQPVGEVGRICRERGIRFHCDAVQAIRKIKVDVKELQVDSLSLSSHKIYGPQGVGALYLKDGLSLEPLLVGGPHEGKRRSGTENVPGIVGFGEACRLALEEGPVSGRLTAYLYEEIKKSVSGVALNGNRQASLPQTLNLSFEGMDNASLLIALDQEGVAVSTGSACMAGSLAPSSVLLASGFSEERAKSAIRFSLGKDNTRKEVATLVGMLQRLIPRIRG